MEDGTSADTEKQQKKKKLRGFSPPANYTDRATAACRRNSDIKSNMEIPNNSAALYPENHLIITFLLCYWSLKAKVDIFPIQEYNPYSKQCNKTEMGNRLRYTTYCNLYQFSLICIAKIFQLEGNLNSVTTGFYKSALNPQSG
jgi:hypothetical protein